MAVKVTGPNKPEGLGDHLIAVNKPSAPLFSASLADILML